MKRTLTIITMLMLALGTAFATDNRTEKAENIKLIPGENQKYHLIYPFQNKDRVKIQFKDQKGKRLGSDNIWNRNGFKQTYDLSTLKDGKYVVEITDSEGTVNKQIEIGPELSTTLAYNSRNRKS